MSRLSTIAFLIALLINLRSITRHLQDIENSWSVQLYSRFEPLPWKVKFTIHRPRDLTCMR